MRCSLSPSLTPVPLGFNCIVRMHARTRERTTGNATAAHDMASLRQRRITHVLTLDSCPLPAHILQQPDIVNKYVQGKRGGACVIHIR